MPTSRTRPQSEARQRFVRAVNIRVNNALVEIAKISKLSSPRYEYSPSDVDQIMAALEEGLENVRQQLSARNSELERRTIIAE